VGETSKYYNQYLDTPDNDGRCSGLPDVAVQEMYTFLATIIEMGHDVKDIVKSF
jgi:hypothetical protein